MRAKWLGFALLLACTGALFAVAEEAPRMPSIQAAPCLAPTDSTTVRLSWTAVMDRRGQPVVRYVYTFVRNAVTVVTDSTTNTTVTRRFACPQYGDSVAFEGTVLAVDNRGNRGAVGRSPRLVLRTVDPGPVAPSVQIDTVATGLEVQLDSIVLYAFGEDEVTQRFIATGRLNVGDEIQLCPLIFPTGGTPGLPEDYQGRCSPQQGMIYRYLETRHAVAD